MHILQKQIFFFKQILSLLIILYFVTFILANFLHPLESQYTDKWTEKSLIKDLLRDYEKRARPVVDGMSPEITVGNTTVQQITVAFGLGLIQILQLNENEQILTVSVRSLYVSYFEVFFSSSYCMKKEKKLSVRLRYVD